MTDSLLVFKQQQTREGAGTEEQLTQGGGIAFKQDGQDAGVVAAQQAFHVAVKALGAVVGQQQQARDAPAAFLSGLPVGDAQTALFACEPVFGKLQATDDLAGMVDAFQGGAQAVSEFDLRYRDFAPGPQRPGMRTQQLQDMIPARVLFDRPGQAGDPWGQCVAHIYNLEIKNG